jgi:hypothetical protein
VPLNTSKRSERMGKKKQEVKARECWHCHIKPLVNAKGIKDHAKTCLMNPVNIHDSKTVQSH